MEGDVIPEPAMRTTMSSVEILHVEYLRVIIVKLVHLKTDKIENGSSPTARAG